MDKLLVALLVASVATACGNKAEEPASPASGSAAKAEATAEAAKQALTEGAAKIDGAQAAVDTAKDLKAVVQGAAGKALTLDQYEQLMLGLASCQVDDRGIDRKCEGWKKFDEARRDGGALLKGLGGQLADLGRKHVKHASPAVRVQAANLMSSVFGATADSQKAIVEAASTEQDPIVVKQMLRAVASAVGKNPDVLKLVLDSAAHADEKVRLEVITALTSTWAKNTEGTLEKAMEMAEKDASDDVRQYACRRLGQRGEEKALPLLEKLTADAAKDPKMYAACLKGLIAMWSSPITHDKPSEKAYKLTLDRLKAKPRTEGNPPWTAMSSMHWAKQDKFQERAKWFKKDELLGVLADIVADREANWMARTGAIDTMARLGADKAVFEKQKKAYEEFKDKPGVDKHVYQKLEKVLAGGE